MSLSSPKAPFIKEKLEENHARARHQARLGVSGREIDETIAKAQIWLDRAASMWEIEGLSMEDGWRVGGREDGAAGLIGNRLTDSKLGKWLRVVDSFACYLGPRMIYE